MKIISENDILNATKPSDIFSMDINILESEKDKFIERFKPISYNKVKNFTIMQKVILLYRQALFELQEDDDSKCSFDNYTKPLLVIKNKNNTYRFYENIFEGEVAHILKGATESNNIVYLKIPINSSDDNLIKNECKILSSLKHQSMPYIIDVAKVNSKTSIIMKEIKGISMIELLKEYPNGIPEEHVMWMLERLLSSVGYLHSNCIVHGNIKPDNIMINKDNHNVSLTGFSFAILDANKDSAQYKIKNKYYTAPEVRKDVKVLPSSDIYSIGKIAIKLLGGDVVTGEIPDSVDEDIRKFIKKMINNDPSDRPDDAWKLWTELISLRIEVFGTKRFKKLD